MGVDYLIIQGCETTDALNRAISTLEADIQSILDYRKETKQPKAEYEQLAANRKAIREAKKVLSRRNQSPR